VKLGILSDAPHGEGPDGRLHGPPVLVRQFECWASLFSEVILLAPNVNGALPGSHAPYALTNLKHRPIRAAGGNTLRAKGRLLLEAWWWWREIRRLLRDVDALHIRCPNNVAVPGLLASLTTRHRKHAVYTGSWAGYPGEPWTYRFQRSFLRRWFRGPVGVYGDWASRPAHVVPTFSPTFSDAEWEAEEPAVRRRLERVAATDSSRGLRLLTVGALTANKNQRIAIEGVQALCARGWDVTLEIVGDGPLRPSLERQVGDSNLEGRVTFRGYLARAGVEDAYRRADFLVQPSRTEGFPKSVVDACRFGAAAILSDIPAHRSVFAARGAAALFSPCDGSCLAATVERLAREPAVHAGLVAAARAWSRGLTYGAFRSHLRDVLTSSWGLPASALGRDC